MYEQAGQVVLEIPLRLRILHRLVVMIGRSRNNRVVVVVLVIFVIGISGGCSSGSSSGYF